MYINEDIGTPKGLFQIAYDAPLNGSFTNHNIPKISGINRSVTVAV
jgi:hypothetical protein